MIRQVGEWIASVATFLGAPGVFLVALADSALIPMPQGVDALLVAQAIATPESAYVAAALGSLGSTIGSVALYLVARRAGRAVLERRVSEEGIRRLGELVGNWGAAALIPVALIPLPMPMKPVVLASGTFQMPLAAFSLVVLGSRMARYCGIVYLADRYGESALQQAAENAHIALIACLLFVVLYFAVHRMSNRWLER